MLGSSAALLVLAFTAVRWTRRIPETDRVTRLSIPLETSDGVSDGKNLTLTGIDLSRDGSRVAYSYCAPCDSHQTNSRVYVRQLDSFESAPVPVADKEFLLHRLEELQSELPRLQYPLAPAAIHGDAWVENLMVCDNQSILIDFERFAWGQPEWDLAQMATEYQTAGLFTHAEYGQFVEAYGAKVSRAPYKRLEEIVQRLDALGTRLAQRQQAAVPGAMATRYSAPAKGR